MNDASDLLSLRRVAWTLFALVVLALPTGALVWDHLRAQALPEYGAVADFTAINQDGAPVTDESLRGTTWIVGFLFTSCPDVCPLTTTRMVGLEPGLPPDGVGLLAITVDPERDTPVALRTWADRFHTDPRRWTWLTGEPAQVQAILQGFHMAAQKMPSADGSTYSVAHSEKLALVDATGQIRGFYDQNEEGLAAIARDARLLRP